MELEKRRSNRRKQDKRERRDQGLVARYERVKLVYVATRALVARVFIRESPKAMKDKP